MKEEDKKLNTNLDSTVDLCKDCEHWKECNEREEKEPHILESQFLHCHEVVGRRDFQPDECWIFEEEEK
jgi:hypothetical protein